MNKLKGGKSDKMSLEDIARKHSQFIGTIQKALEKGMKVESEHTTDKNKAREIAMDHLSEDPEYYEKLKKMEAKEQTGADASGSVEGPIFGKTILKKDIHKLHNFKPKDMIKEMDAGVSAGAMYDGPIGTAGPSSPMDKTVKKRKDPLALDEKTRTASITAASTKGMKSTKKGFPRFGGPNAKFVEIDSKCKKFPYCNQGDGDNKLKFVNENPEMKKAIQEAAKKYGVSIQEVEKMVVEALPVGMFDDSNTKAFRSWTDKGKKDKFNISTGAPINITTDDDIDIAKIKVLFFRYNIDFKITKVEGKE
jgi:hypothetical protein